MISICLATYNGMKFLPSTLPLICQQLTDDDEIIICDDASTDNTFEYISNYKSAQIKVFQNDINKGSTYTFFKAIQHAKNNIVTLADQDDLWYYNKLVTIRKTFKKNPDLSVLVHDADIFISDNNTNISFFKKLNSQGGLIKNLYQNSFIGCCMTFNKHELYLPCFIILSRLFYHDFYIGIMATLQRKKIKFITLSLIKHIRHQENTTTHQCRRIDKIILSRLILVINLFVNFFFQRVLFFLGKNQ
jgi:glycosyltransferase involved in cell wall biosynthesis